MKLFTTSQIADIDRYTIQHEPISDIDLMERAALAIFNRLYPEMVSCKTIVFFAGPGNNGGDALAVARMFAEKGFDCKTYLLNTGKALSPSCQINLNRLEEQGLSEIYPISTKNNFPVIGNGIPVIDGLFGSGLTRPLSGLAAWLVEHINNSSAKVYSIDIPSGLMGESNPDYQQNAIIKAFKTITLQFPKISLLFPENEPFTGKVETVDIGLHPEAIKKTQTPYYLTSVEMIRKSLPQRSKFSHKGNYGHALLIAGSYGKMGAAVLASSACMRSGAGLLTTHVPRCGYSIMQVAFPEAMCVVDPDEEYFTQVPALEKYTAIGVGPGIETHEKTAEALKKMLSQVKVPLVLDADALNLVSMDKELLPSIPENSILTPHPGEFRRLFGETANSWDRLQLLIEKAVLFQLIIILKGAFTAIALPSGKVYFNPTGNPGMATGGSGDALTGIILGLLAQGLSPADAAISGVYLHGLAGDHAASAKSEPATIASDIINFIGTAYRAINNSEQQDF